MTSTKHQKPENLVVVWGTVLSKSLDPHFDEFPGFSGLFGDISANFRDAYCPNPRELSNDISLCSKYRGENALVSLRIFERTFVRFSKRF